MDRMQEKNSCFVGLVHWNVMIMITKMMCLATF